MFEAIEIATITNNIHFVKFEVISAVFMNLLSSVI
jgi:hypothetical protein